MNTQAASECIRTVAYVLGPALDVTHASTSPQDPSRLSVRTLGALEPLRYVRATCARHGTTYGATYANIYVT